MRSQTHNVVPHCRYGWEEELQVIMIAEVHKCPSLCEMFFGCAWPEGMPGQGVSSCAKLQKGRDILQVEGRHTIIHQRTEMDYEQF